MNKIQTKFILDAMDSEDILTSWERDFINDLAVKPESYQLGQKQNEILNRISQKINSR